MPDVSKEVSKEKLENELRGIESSIEDIEERVEDLEDKDMMAQLKSMSIEEEVQEVEELLNHMSREELEKRLNMIEQIKEEYQEGKIHEKLEYLYQQIKEVRQNMEGFDSENGENLAERINELEQQIDEIEVSNKKSSTGEDSKARELAEKNRKKLQDIRKEIEQIEKTGGSKEKSQIESLSNNIKEIERAVQSGKSLKPDQQTSQGFDQDAKSLLNGKVDWQEFKRRLSEKASQSRVEQIERRLDSLNVSSGNAGGNSPNFSSGMEIGEKFGTLENRLSEMEESIQNLKNSDNISEIEAGDLETAQILDRLQELEEDFEGSSDERIDEMEKELGKIQDRIDRGHHKRAQKSSEANFSQIKRLEADLEEVKSKLDSLPTEKVDQLDEKIEDVVSELIKDLDRIEETDSEPASLSFDIESIKSRISSLEKQRANDTLDQTQLRELRRRVKQAEKKAERPEKWRDLREEIDRLESDIDEIRHEKASVDKLEDEIEKTETNLENQIRTVRSEVNRAVDEGEERLKSMEETLENEVLDNLTKTEYDLNEKIDSISEMIYDNQEAVTSLEETIEEKDEKIEDTAEELKNEIQQVDKNIDSRVERLRSRVRGVEKEVDTKDELKKNKLERVETRIAELEEDFKQREKQRKENLEIQSELPGTTPKNKSDENIVDLEMRVEEIEENDLTSLEKKIENLAEHVMTNQEKIHDIARKLELTKKKGSAETSDYTIIS